MQRSLSIMAKKWVSVSLPHPGRFTRFEYRKKGVPPLLMMELPASNTTSPNHRYQQGKHRNHTSKSSVKEGDRFSSPPCVASPKVLPRVFQASFPSQVYIYQQDASTCPSQTALQTAPWLTPPTGASLRNNPLGREGWHISILPDQALTSRADNRP